MPENTTSLLQAIYQSGVERGMGMMIAEDIQRTSLTYRKLFIKTFALSGALKNRIGNRRNIGILLPTSLAGLVTLLSLLKLNKTPALLNFSAGLQNIILAMQTADADTLLTSRTFIKKGGLEDIINGLSERYNVVYLEDMRKHIGLGAKLKAALCGYITPLCKAGFPSIDASDTAIILFTSGSEGAPKGVALSHRNILTNIGQVKERLSFTEGDVMFNALPIFHSFGLTAGTLLPLIFGFKTFLYPSPLHYKIIPELVAHTKATILLGTDTFFRGYVTYAKPEDFNTLRLAVAGAERLKPATFELYKKKYGIEILQGYGVTEASPIISCNVPEANRPETVGKLMTGMAMKLADVEGLTDGKKLLVSGANVMQGYMRHSAPGVIEPQEEWYDTGDIVEVDDTGHIRIVGRAKRFAKIGGEMVSLAVVEECASEHWPEALHAAVAIPDDRKGEQIVLFTEQEGLTRSDFLEKAKVSGLPEIALPRKVTPLPEIPKLGSGKVDYVGLGKLV